MANGIKVANSGINALTDTNPKNFSLYVDGSLEHILVKEQSRGTGNATSGATREITHSLGSVPQAMVHVEVSSGEFQQVYGNQGFSDFSVWATTSKLFMKNLDASTRAFTHIIFYDQL